jgi:hypothetical protein
MAASKPNQHGYRAVSTKWSSGNLQYLDSSGNVIFTVDAANRLLSIPAGSGVINSGRVNEGAAVAETYAATVSIDTTKPFHRIAGSNATSATATFNASTHGNDGDDLTIEVTSDSGGTCTITFGTNFKSSGTLAVTASHYASVWFTSDGTNWKEQSRSAIIAS